MLAFDFETLLIRPSQQNPPPVCMSVAPGPTLYPTPEAREAFGALLATGLPIVGHNVTYDLTCALAWWGFAEEIIEALEADRILDTLVIERLAEIGGLTTRKELSLDVLHAAHGLGTLDKDPVVRLSYGPLLNRPLGDYSERQRQYACDDATATLALYSRQHERWIAKGLIHIPDVADMVRKRMWLETTRARGLPIDPARLDTLRVSAREQIAELRAAAQLLGVVRPNGSRDMKVLRAMVTEAYGGRPPMTKEPRRKKDAPPRKKPWRPQVATKRSVLEESGDARLEALAEYAAWSTVENSIVPAFEAGAIWPIHTKWNIADTTRTTSSKPPMQNIRRKPGIRECVTPRPGYCFVSADHGGLENATLAQVIATNLRRYTLARFLNADGDLHCLVAAAVYGCTYEQARELYAAGDSAFCNVRNAVKPINFGRPGGAGWKTLRFIAKQAYHLDWSEAQTKAYIAAWERAVPDGKAYLDWIGTLPTDAQGRIAVRIPGTTIVRRGCTFCSACNNGFQSLGAVIEARVGWVLWKLWVRGQIPGYMCHFIHDEFMFEVPIGRQTEVADTLERVMCEVPKRDLPDVKIAAEAKAMAYWSKDAKRIVRDGELQIWSG